MVTGALLLVLLAPAQSWLLSVGRRAVTQQQQDGRLFHSHPLHARKPKQQGGSSGANNKKPAPKRQRTIEEVGRTTVKLGRVDFPPTPDTQFPASVDYLLTVEDVGLSLPGLAVPEGGPRYSFTLDTTASVNLITKEVRFCG